MEIMPRVNGYLTGMMHNIEQEVHKWCHINHNDILQKVVIYVLLSHYASPRPPTYLRFYACKLRQPYTDRR